MNKYNKLELNSIRNNLKRFRPYCDFKLTLENMSSTKHFSLKINLLEDKSDYMRDTLLDEFYSEKVSLYYDMHILSSLIYYRKKYNRAYDNILSPFNIAMRKLSYLSDIIDSYGDNANGCIFEVYKMN